MQGGTVGIDVRGRNRALGGVRKGQGPAAVVRAVSCRVVSCVMAVAVRGAPGGQVGANNVAVSVEPK